MWWMWFNRVLCVVFSCRCNWNGTGKIRWKTSLKNVCETFHLWILNFDFYTLAGPHRSHRLHNKWHILMDVFQPNAQRASHFCFLAIVTWIRKPSHLYFECHKCVDSNYSQNVLLLWWRFPWDSLRTSWIFYKTKYCNNFLMVSFCHFDSLHAACIQWFHFKSHEGRRQFIRSYCNPTPLEPMNVLHIKFSINIKAFWVHFSVSDGKILLWLNFSLLASGSFTPSVGAHLIQSIL